MISLVRRWWHKDAAERCWREIYDHLEEQVQTGESVTDLEIQDVKYLDDPAINVTDSATSLSVVSPTMTSEECINSSTEPDAAVPLDTSNQEDDACGPAMTYNTIIRYRNLTIKIRKLIIIDNSLQISLAIHEVRNYVHTCIDRYIAPSIILFSQCIETLHCKN